ncbi:hypothetical protein ACWGCW_25455 [Streptomyces sp. NPDC054933]
MAFGFTPETGADTASRLSRILGLDEWTECGIPLLPRPREVIKDLYTRHLPSPSTAVVAVFAPDGRAAASASFTQRAASIDGWEHRNAILAHLRRVIPHDLRRRVPMQTAVLLVCRDGTPDWTATDGAWMWGLRDACTLHGLRCGAYITLTPDGWHVLGDGRSGRTPQAASWSKRSGTPASLGSTGEAPQAVRRQVAR